MPPSILKYIKENRYYSNDHELIVKAPDVSDEYLTCHCCRADFVRYRQRCRHKPPACYPLLRIPVYDETDDETDDDDESDDDGENITLSNVTMQSIEAQAIVGIISYMILKTPHMEDLHQFAIRILNMTAYGLIVTASDYPEVSILSGLSQCYGAIPRNQICYVDRNRHISFSDYPHRDSIISIMGRQFNIDDIYACLKALDLKNDEQYEDNFQCLFLKCFTLSKIVLQQIIESLDETSTLQTILESLLPIPEFAGQSSNGGESLLDLFGLYEFQGDYCNNIVFYVPPPVPKVQASRRK